PFHFDGTFHKPSYFPNKLDAWESGQYWQALRLDKKLYGLKVEDKGTAKTPKIKATIFYQGKISKDNITSLKQEIVWRFDLMTDLREFNQFAKKDKRFHPIFKKWLGMRVSSPHNLYELLVVSLLLQNATVRRTVQMLNVLLNKYGTKLKFDHKEIFAIWLPEDLRRVSERELRNLKIGYRAKFLKRFSQDFASDQIDEAELRQLDQDAARDKLMKLYGVGPETARILLFEVFHHYNTFDHVSPWQQKIYSRLFYRKPLVSANKIRDDIRKRYGRYSMLAVHYIWEDIFWRRKNEKIDWLEKEIRL
ncbi:MAG: hypothetical protein NTY61_00140, partial [Candidatus Parcubacteria bacterium]|nr:hypothetical protein [Candidatus Parcubacteria bacterium]